MAMMFAVDANRQKAAWEYIKFVTGPVGQTQMVNLTGYMPGNEIAVENSEMLGSFYSKNPNHKTSIDQLPIVTEWASFPGNNSLKIIEIIKTNTENLITRRQTAEETMPILAKEVVTLLPPCASQ